MKKTNFHSHTFFCNHSDLTPKESIKLHREAGYKILGFSEHAPIPDYEDKYRLSFAELDEYIPLVKKEASQVSDIEILCGLEAEYLFDCPKQLENLKYLYERTDYLILANHIIGDFRGGDFVHFGRDNPSGEDLLLNAKLIEEGWNTGLFAFIAHPDSILKNYIWDGYAEKMAHMIGQFAERTGALLEINSNGLRGGAERTVEEGTYRYTNLNFLKILSKYKVNVIVSGDTHWVTDVNHDSEKLAKELVKRYNFKVYDDFREHMKDYPRNVML